jgi:hypothetical protein
MLGETLAVNVCGRAAVHQIFHLGGFDGFVFVSSTSPKLLLSALSLTPLKVAALDCRRRLVVMGTERFPNWDRVLQCCWCLTPSTLTEQTLSMINRNATLSLIFRKLCCEGAEDTR